jgi:hypothetical protein
MESIDLIPLFITAKTKEELVRKMFLNNIKRGKHLKYFQIEKIGKQWIAWYYDKLDAFKDLTDGSRKKNN